MTPQKAIKILERLQEPEPWGQQITSETWEALQVAIDALRKRITGLKILKIEQEVWSHFLEKNYHKGRLTGLYDGLGIDFLGD